MPRRLCIVSGSLLRCDAFIPALSSLSRDDELEIVVDRRRADASDGTASRAGEERRFRPYLDLALKVDGFAIVPWSPTPELAAPAPAPTPAPRPMPIPTPAPALAPAAPPPHRFPPASPLDRFVIDDEDEADRERLERILRFKPRRRVGAWAVVLVAGAIGVAIFAAMPALRDRLGPLMPAAPRPSSEPKLADRPEESTVATQTLPPVTEAPATPPEPAASPATSAASAESAPAREPVAPPALPEPSARAPRPRPSTATSRVVSPPSATPKVVSPPIASASVTSPGPTRPEMSPSMPGVPRVELSRAGARASEGETYTVRVSDTTGRPLTGADILLLARMSDGTAASIPLSSGGEPGTYHGTMPSGRSSLVDLRVRVTTSDKRVEIPFSP